MIWVQVDQGEEFVKLERRSREWWLRKGRKWNRGFHLSLVVG